VNYNTKELLQNLLNSIKESDLNGIDYEIIVVDNNSTDGSVQLIKEKFREVKLIENKKNLGYAKANNQALRLSKGKYFLLLNSDTIVFKDTLKTMIEFMNENKQYSASTCRVELENGEIDPASHRGFPTPWAAFCYFSGLEKLFPKSKIFAKYHMGWKDLEKVHELDVISGAFFMIRKKALEKAGFLDERFFMYAEDIDLCFRMAKKGMKIGYNPNTKIVHFKKSSGRKKGKGKKVTQKDVKIRKQSSEYFFKTMKLFYEKHYKDKHPWIVRKIVLLGIRVVSKFKE